MGRVMNGAASDLRTGLPAQMIEIHEPIRLQLVIESKPAVLAAILKRQPGVAELVQNAWVVVITVDPDTGELLLFVPGQGFVPWNSGRTEPPSVDAVPTTPSWHAYYQGHRSFLPPARLSSTPHQAVTTTRRSKREKRGAR